MTAEMIHEKTLPIPEEPFPGTEAPTSFQRSVRNSAALATQEQLDGLAEYVRVVEKELGPVPIEICEQFDADLAAADAKIGRIRLRDSSR